MALQEEETHLLQNPHFVMDRLYCEEDLGESCKSDKSVKKGTFLSSNFLEQDRFWADDELSSLICKEKQTHLCFRNLISDGSLVMARREAVDWIWRVNAHYGFTALTSVLSVNYFDRFITSLRFHRDKPWMSQLAAVACVSLAAKVEETQVPLLLDLQVEDSMFVFEAKTIQRMELLVLSTLEWRMNPVTPISFFDHIIRRLDLKSHLHWEFLRRCERLLLSVIADLRLVCYYPSILAAATMLHVIKEVDPCNQVEYQNKLTSVLKISEGKLNECCKLILELSGSHAHSQNRGHKRKHSSTPGSPNGVVDVIFSCDSSSDSWAVASSVSSSPAYRYKRRAQDQQMRLPSLNRMFALDVLSSPH